MHKHPVNISWKKNTNGLSEARSIFKKVNRLDGAERCVQIVEGLIRSRRLFEDKPPRAKGFTLHTEVTIDPKTVKIADGADNKRPVTLLKLNGVALLLVRPDLDDPRGLLLKVCPHNGVRLLLDRSKFLSEISEYNKDFEVESPAMTTRYHPLLGVAANMA